MEKSTHKCEVVEVKLETHPNADQLSIVPVWGYKCVVRTADWKDKQLGVYIPPDSVVPTDKPEFAFLGKHSRIKARKFRGIMSFGLLVSAPEGAKVGDDCADFYGVTHYEPELAIATSAKGRRSLLTGGEVASPPPGVASFKYDVDNLRRFPNVIQEGEMVVVREKIHGANSRFVCVDGVMHCGSRTEWKKEYASKPNVTREYLLENGVPEEGIQEIINRIEEKYKNPRQNMWWKVLRQYPQIEVFCRSKLGFILFGETYGQVQDLKYGTKTDEVRFVAFDILTPWGEYKNADELNETLVSFNIPQPPLLSEIGFLYNFEEVCKLAEGPTLIEGANHEREGCVVRVVKERWDERVGRCQLKVVSGDFLEKH